MGSKRQFYKSSKNALVWLTRAFFVPRSALLQTGRFDFGVVIGQISRFEKSGFAQNGERRGIIVVAGANIIALGLR